MSRNPDQEEECQDKNKIRAILDFQSYPHLSLITSLQLQMISTYTTIEMYV